MPAPKNLGPRPFYAWKTGRHGPGYYRVAAADIPPVAKKRQDARKPPPRGWGQRAVSALLLGSVSELRAAAEAEGRERKKQINLKVRGAFDYYYGNYRGEGLGPNTPRQGDTLLHWSLRLKLSPEFVATLLELGADRQIRNGLGELPEEIEATTLQAADKIHEKRKAVELLRKKGVPVSASSS